MNSTSLLAIFVLGGTIFGQQSGTGNAELFLPKSKVVLALNVGSANWETRTHGNETQLRALDRGDHLLITAFLQKVKFPASAEACRGKWWPMTEKSAPMKRDQLRQYEKNGVALVDYRVDEYRGTSLRQRTIHAYLGGSDFCAEVHLSKEQFGPDDEKLFDSVLESVQLRFDQSAADDHDQKDQLLAEGSRFYLQHDYQAAAKPYQKALDLEKQNRTLNKTTFRVLVDNLGMSYGLTGKLSNARETFEYGISQEAEYPMFYYLLACTYGAMGKLNESLDQLRLAYKYKANVIAGESLPDPLKDDSFRKFARDDNFVRAVREMQRD